MKKFTLLFVFLALTNWSLSAQCIRTYSGPNVVSNNMGLPQTIGTCAWTTTDFVTVTSLVVGNDYEFTCFLGETNKYITVTDLDNVVITQGFSPLTVTAITNADVRLHLSDDDMCTGVATCHTVTVQAILQCPVPVDLAIQNLATTSVDFNWQPVGSETSWDVLILPSASPFPLATAGNYTTVTNNPAFSAVDLSANTSYKFYYRAVCAATEKSPWNFSPTFTTLCESVTYFSENFDASSSIPGCWTKVGSQGSAVVQSSSSAASLPNNFYMSDFSNATDKPILDTPVVSNFNAGTHRIKFKVKGAFSAGGTVEFGYLYQPNNGSTFTSLVSYNATSASVYDQYTFVPGALDLQTGYLAFRVTGSVVLDDVIWEAVPSCADVTEFTLVSYSSNSAVLSYSSTTPVEVVYSAAANANPNELTPIAVTTELISLFALASNATYKVWVRSVCANNEYGAWIGPKLFKTNCEPVTSFSQNFDAATTFPSCWKRVGTGGSAYIQSVNGAPSSPNALNMSSYDTSYGIVAMPAVSNAATGTHRLKFSLRAASSVGGVVEVGYLTNSDDPASFVSLNSYTATSSSAFETIVYIPEANTVLSETFAFRHSATPTFSVYIDTVIWELIPNCGDVTAIQTVNVTNNSVDVSWTASTDAETTWQVAYGVNASDPNTATIVDVTGAPTTTLTSLSDASTYAIWVRSKCSEGNFGAWIGPKSIVTLCNSVTELFENFDASNDLPACWSKVGSGTLFFQENTDASLKSIYISDATLALPPLSNTGANTHKLSFKARAAYTVGGVIEVGYLQDANDATSFVALDTFSPNSTTEFEVFNAYLGSVPTTPYLAIRHTGVPFDAVLLDEISWELLPTCADVTSIETDLITDNSALITWAAGTATNWQIAVGGSTANDPTILPLIDVAAAIYALTNLTEANTYKYWIRTNCGAGEFGAWIGPKTFNTKCEPIAFFPWTETFDEVTTPAIPSCWTKENGDYTTSDFTYILGPNSGDNYLKNNSNAVNEYVWTPGFALQASHSYDLSTLVRGDGYDNWTVKMAYNTYSKSEGATVLGDTFQVAGNANVLISLPYAEMTRTFVPTTDGTYYFALVVNENVTGFPVGIAFDNVSLTDNGLLSTPGFETATLKVYPNPVKDILNISNTQNINSVEVFNLLGQKVLTKTTQNATNSQVDLSALAAGSYLVRITADNVTQTVKVIKQ